MLDEVINIVYITDSNYLLPTCVSIKSAIDNSEEIQMCIFVVCDVPVGEDLHCIKALETNKCKINILRVDSSCYEGFCDNGVLSHVSRTALFKFDICNILKDIDKVVYIDGDTVVLKALDKLYNINIDDYWLGAVNDLANDVMHYRLSQQIDLCDVEYFNSGVMLINLKKWREDNISEKLIEYKANGINYFMDQDALNAVLGKKRLKLEFEYNFMSTLSDNLDLNDIYENFNVEEPINNFREYLNKMSIVHFTFNLKPWEYNLPWYTDLFIKYYNRTPYKDKVLELKSPIKLYKDIILQKPICEELLIPYKEIGRDSRIVIYGAGKIGNRCRGQFKIFGYGNVVGWVDKYKSDNDVSSIDKLCELEYDYILVAIKNRTTVEGIIDELVGIYGVPSEKILSVFKWS